MENKIYELTHVNESNLKNESHKIIKLLKWYKISETLNLS